MLDSGVKVHNLLVAKGSLFLIGAQIEQEGQIQ